MAEDQPDLGRKPKRRTHNRLDRKKTRQLEDWLIANWADIKSRPMTIIELARRATRQLEMSVSDGNITGCLRALELEWPHNNRRSGRSYIEASQAKAVVVARCLIALLDELGSDVPSELLRCADPHHTRKRQRFEDKESEAEADA